MNRFEVFLLWPSRCIFWTWGEIRSARSTVLFSCFRKPSKLSLLWPSTPSLPSPLHLVLRLLLPLCVAFWHRGGLPLRAAWFFFVYVGSVLIWLRFGWSVVTVFMCRGFLWRNVLCSVVFCYIPCLCDTLVDRQRQREGARVSARVGVEWGVRRSQEEALRCVGAPPIHVSLMTELTIIFIVFGPWGRHSDHSERDVNFLMILYHGEGWDSCFSLFSSL